MADEEFVEIRVDHRRKYSLEHLWFQEKDDRFTVGISDYLAGEIGEVLRVILPHAETEVEEGQDLLAVWTAERKVAFTAPFPGTVAEVNGEVEATPELVSNECYGDGWLIIFEAHGAEPEGLMEPEEYIEAIEELLES